MNRTLKRDDGSLHARVVHLYGKAAIGASGAATMDTAVSRGITSITRSATGTYDVVLADKYAALLELVVMHSKATAADITVQLKDVSASAGTLSFFTKAGASAADPASGDALYIHITMKNSSV